MNVLLGAGKYFFVIFFLIFGVFYFMNVDVMVGMVLLLGGVIWVYFMGVVFIVVVVFIFMGKMDKLVIFLLGVMLLIFVLVLYFKGVMVGDQMFILMLLKDMVMVGGVWIYVVYVVKDNVVIGQCWIRLIKKVFLELQIGRVFFLCFLVCF